MISTEEDRNAAVKSLILAAYEIRYSRGNDIQQARAALSMAISAFHTTARTEGFRAGQEAAIRAGMLAIDGLVGLPPYDAKRCLAVLSALTLDPEEG